MKSIIVIPARMQSKRFPGKPLVSINGKPMILHVIENAKKANIGPVLLACCDEEIAQVGKEAGIQSVMTDIDLKSGTDRVYKAIKKFDKSKEYDLIINLQGDIPYIKPFLISKLKNMVKMHRSEITTLVSPLKIRLDKNNPNIVKVAIAWKNNKFGKALYFSRSIIPYKASNYYEHIGIYAYTRQSLENFIHLGTSYLEKQESLEQLRALEYGMTINVCLVDSAPVGVDVPNDIKLL